LQFFAKHSFVVDSCHWPLGGLTLSCVGKGCMDLEQAFYNLQGSQIVSTKIKPLSIARPFIKSITILRFVSHFTRYSHVKKVRIRSDPQHCYFLMQISVQYRYRY
jgi:hypothetical protein